MQTPINDWLLWKYVTASDTDLANEKPSTIANRDDNDDLIVVRGWETIMFRAFGTDAENETFEMRIYGLMDNGPPAEILHVDGILGATTFSEKFIETPQGGSVPSQAYFEADTYAFTSNLAVATTPTASVENFIHSHVILPTLSYKYLMLKFLNVDGTAEASSMGAIWRPVKPLTY